MIDLIKIHGSLDDYSWDALCLNETDSNHFLK